MVVKSRVKYPLRPLNNSSYRQTTSDNRQASFGRSKRPKPFRARTPKIILPFSSYGYKNREETEDHEFCSLRLLVAGLMSSRSSSTRPASSRALFKDPRPCTRNEWPIHRNHSQTVSQPLPCSLRGMPQLNNRIKRKL
jgi:hypothetical protein